MFRKSWSFARFAVFCIYIYFFELCVKYDVSTFIDYSFRTFDVIFIVWPLLYVWPLSTYDVRMMYDVLYTTFRLMRCLFSFNYS